jgi:hypothetical protein
VPAITENITLCASSICLEGYTLIENNAWMSLDEYIVDNDQELISQLAELGIKPHGFNDKQQDEKYRQWEEDLKQGHKGLKKKKQEEKEKEEFA